MISVKVHMKHFIIAMIGGLLLVAPASHARETTAKEEAIYRVSLGNVKDAVVLIRKVGNPNLVDNLGWPLLAIAAARSDDQALAMTQALVQMGADVNYGGSNHNYPIMFAVQSGNADVVRYLLANGANYRKSDAYGVRVVDFARQSGNKEIIRMIEDAIDTDILNLARIRSQSYLDELAYNLAYHSCASQYYSYYFQSGQDPIPEEEQKRILKKHDKIVGDSMSQLSGIFRIRSASITDIYTEARGRIFNEMELLISNRWRRHKGVGQPGDMEKRCEPLVEDYKEDYFDKDELEEHQHGRW